MEAALAQEIDLASRAIVARTRLKGARALARDDESRDFRAAVEYAIETWRAFSAWYPPFSAGNEGNTDEERAALLDDLQLLIGFIAEFEDRESTEKELAHVSRFAPDLLGQFTEVRTATLKNARDIAAVLSFVLDEPQRFDEILGYDFSLNVDDVGPGPGITIG